MDKSVLTTHDIANLIAVDISTVSNWIDQGRMTAYRTPGGHRRVRREDLLSFMETHRIPHPEAPRSGPSVLIVEDDADFRRALQRMIETIPGLSAHEAEDGFSAGRRLQELRPDVVLLDLLLPGMDGFKVCRQIRQDPQLARTKVIVVSGQDDPESRRKAGEAGADAFLAKPLGLARLRDAILSAMIRPTAGR